MKHFLAIVLLFQALLTGAQVTASPLFLEADSLEKASEFAAARERYLSLAEATADKADKAMCLHRAGRCSLNLNDLSAAIDFTSQALNMRQELFGENSPEYIVSLNNLALAYFLQDDYQTALRHGLKVIELTRNTPTVKPADEAMYTTNLGRYYCLLEMWPEASEAWLSVLEMPAEDATLEFAANGLTYVYSEKYYDEEGINKLMAFIERYNEEQLHKEHTDPKDILDKARYLAFTGDFEAAAATFRQLVEMDLDPAMRVKVYEEYADHLHNNLRDSNGAGQYYSAAADIASDPAKEADLRIKAGLFYYFGNSNLLALQAFEKALTLLADEPAKAVECKSKIALQLMCLDRNDEALSFATEVADYYTVNEPGSENEAKALEHIAQILKRLDRREEALGFYAKAIEIQRALGNDEQVASLIDSYNLSAGIGGLDTRMEYDEAARNEASKAEIKQMIDQTERTLEIDKKYMSPESYLISLRLLAGSYNMIGDTLTGASYYRQYIPELRKLLQSRFATSDLTTRMRLWNDQKEEVSGFFDVLLSPNRPDSVTGAVYDALLLSKGILLNSAIEFEKVVANASDDVKNLYAEVKDAEKALNNLYARPGATSEQILAARNKSDALKAELYRKCSEVATFTDYLGYTWQVVRSKLGPEDVAIEFVIIGDDIFDIYNNVGALVITADTDEPVFVNVMNKNLLKSLMTEDVFKGDYFGKLFWEPLLPYLEGRKRVYFSPDGTLNNIGIEYFALGEDNEPLFNLYDVYRLSSTKELCRRENLRPIRNVTLIGGIDYTGDDPSEASSLDDFMAMDTPYDDIESTRATDGTFADLPQSAEGIRRIYKTLTSGDEPKNVTMLYESLPTHDAFLDLSGTDADIIHIATHGVADNEAADDNEAMNHCRLALAGANLYNGDSSGNGFVTAAEIAGMNLRGTRLAVLSACDSGRGTLADDGVMGLQRGFKNAGVKSLVMSLNPVYDTTTSHMMQAFYRHLNAEETTLSAFRHAIEAIRAVGATPEQCASFILLDAID